MTDFHTHAFDEGTLAKLELYGDYVRTWLPVWIFHPATGRRITIVDFFAGPGHDASGQPGSPLIALKVIRQFTRKIRDTGAQIHLSLNDADPNKAAALRSALQAQSVPETLCTWEVTNLDFPDAFAHALPSLRTGPNLLFLDQQGIKFTSVRIFRELIGLPTTDFIFFIASSTLRRFEVHPSITKHLALPAGTFAAKGFNDTHRAVHSYYRGLAKEESESPYYIGRFSIKKGSNVYGLIFGSAHHVGIEKFLSICWKVDPERGEANFDIDGDRIDEATPRLFPDMDVPRKLQVFQTELETRILAGQLPTDGDVYVACLEEGFLPLHGREIVKALKRKGEITVIGGQPRVSRLGLSCPRNLNVR